MTRCFRCGLASVYHRGIGGINEEVVCRSCGNVDYIYDNDFRFEERIRIRNLLNPNNAILKGFEGFFVCAMVMCAFTSIPLLFLWFMKSKDFYYIFYGILVISACFGLFAFLNQIINNETEENEIRKEVYQN